MRSVSAAILTILLFYSIAVLWIPDRWAWSLFQIGIFALAGAWLIAFALRRATTRLSAALLPLAGVILWGTAQLAFGQTVYHWKSRLSILDWITYLALAFVALQTFGEPRSRHRFLRATAGFALGLSAVAVIQMFTSKGKVYWLFPSGYTDFVLGPFVSRNQYAAFIELLLPMVLWHALQDRRRAVLYQVTAGVMVASVIAGASRAGSLLVSGEIVLFLAIAMARGHVSPKEAGLVLAKLSVCVALFTSVVGWEVLWNRLRQPDPFAGRREILWSSLDMVRARPLWGFGLGTWPTVYPRYAYFDDGLYVNQAHDDWVQWAAEGGFPLLAMMGALAAMAFRPAIRSLWGLGVILVLAHALVDYPLQQRPALAAWFYLFVVLVVQADRQRRPAVE